MSHNAASRPQPTRLGKRGLQFLREPFAELRGTIGGGGYVLDFHMDGALFRQDVITLLEGHGAEHAIKVPFYPRVGLKARVQATRTWTRMDDVVSCADHEVEVAPDTWLLAEVTDKVPHHGQLLAGLDLGAGLAEQHGRDARATETSPLSHAVLRGKVDEKVDARDAPPSGPDWHETSPAVPKLSTYRLAATFTGVAVAATGAGMDRKVAFAHRLAHPPADDGASTTGRS